MGPTIAAFLPFGLPMDMIYLYDCIPSPPPLRLQLSAASASHDPRIFVFVATLCTVRTSCLIYRVWSVCTPVVRRSPSRRRANAAAKVRSCYVSTYLHADSLCLVPTSPCLSRVGMVCAGGFSSFNKYAPSNWRRIIIPPRALSMRFRSHSHHARPDITRMLSLN